MKKSLFTILAAAFMAALFAQPVIQNGNARLPVGWTSPMMVSSGPTNPGATGVNQTWDFSSGSFNPMGTLTVIDYASSAYAGYYNGANYAMELNANGTMLYFYQNYSASGLEEYAAASSGPGNQDYSPNPPTRLVFPMSLGTSFTDSWQKLGEGVNSVTITYDAYGTFITPFNTYTDVVRIKNDYGAPEIDYSFFTVNPLRLLAVHRHADKTLVLIDGASVGQQELVSQEVQVYPNPAKDRICLKMKEPNYANVVFELYNASGIKVLAQEVSTTDAQLQRGNLPGGIYLYHLKTKDGILQIGKLYLL